MSDHRRYDQTKIRPKDYVQDNIVQNQARHEYLINEVVDERLEDIEVGGEPVVKGFTRDTNAQRIVPVETEDGWVVGSDQFDLDSEDTTKNRRSFFNKSNGAFRAGLASNTNWDDSNLGNNSFATGVNTRASGSASHAEGSATVANGSNTHAEGSQTAAMANNSHAEGSLTSATGISSHAEGNNTTASGTNSHAEGSATNANGSRSHAEGLNTTAFGNQSHAEGSQTQANGENSHAQGDQSVASAACSDAIGRHARALRLAQHAHASQSYGPIGDCQTSVFVLSRQIMNSEDQLRLYAGNSFSPNFTASGTNVWTLGLGRAYKVRIEAIARRYDTPGEAAGFSWEGVVARDLLASGGSRIVGEPIESGWGEAGTESWAFDVAIQTGWASDPFLELLATGELGKNIRFAATMYVTEVG